MHQLCSVMYLCLGLFKRMLESDQAFRPLSCSSIDVYSCLSNIFACNRTVKQISGGSNRRAYCFIFSIILRLSYSSMPLMIGLKPSLVKGLMDYMKICQGDTDSGGNSV